MRVIGTGLTDKGAVRANNEDFFLTDNELNLYIVCDGVGGANSGEVASKMAAETCAAYIKKNQNLIDDYYCTGKEKIVVEMMEQAISEACNKVYQAGSKNAKLSGMACTLTALIFLNQKAVLGHVGDSRCYLLRNNQAHAVTEDHTLGKDLRERYAMNETIIKEKKLDHVLNRCIGHYPRVEVDTLFFDILPGDQLVLCSDGLHNYITNPVMLLPMTEDEEQEASLKKLIDYAIQRGGHDNITAVLIEVKLEESIYMGFDSGKTELLNDFSFLERIYLFRNLSFIRMYRIINQCETLEFMQGEIIVSKDDDPGGIYIFFSGKVEIDNGFESQSMHKGDYFGHQSLMHNHRMDFSVTATENSTFLFISSQDYKRLCRNHPKFGVRLLENYLSGCSVNT